MSRGACNVDTEINIAVYHLITDMLAKHRSNSHWLFKYVYVRKAKILLMPHNCMYPKVIDEAICHILALYLNILPMVHHTLYNRIETWAYSYKLHLVSLKLNGDCFTSIIVLNANLFHLFHLLFISHCVSTPWFNPYQ